MGNEELQQIVAVMTQLLNNGLVAGQNIDILANWGIAPGQGKVFTYYTGVESGNPSGNTTNIKTIVYQNNGNTLLTKTISYNATNNVISIITS